MLQAGVAVGGKYRILRKLGQGAMGSVWLARNVTTDREFAIKVLLPEAASAPSALARFLQEAKVCGALRHPSVLEIYDAGSAPELDGAPYLVMERLDGAPLDAVLRQRGALPMRLALDIVAQIARGLQLAHDQGVVHRDLKPANVFLHRPGTGAIVPKVLDFGISKMVNPKLPQIALTQSSAILGSPLYMSPEQMDHRRPLDARSDVHALGILLWECLVGKPPFSSTTYNLLVVEIMNGPRPHLRDVLPEASPELASVVERAFAIDVRARIGSASELADALEEELARVGGGVLASRTAAAEFLGGLERASSAPPPTHGSTTEPLSVDAGSGQQRSPSARSVIVSSPALEGTEAMDGPLPPAPATSQPSRRPSSSASGSAPIVAPPPRVGRVTVYVGGGVLALALVVGGVVLGTPTMRAGGGAPASVSGSGSGSVSGSGSGSASGSGPASGSGSAHAPASAPALASAAASGSASASASAPASASLSATEARGGASGAPIAKRPGAGRSSASVQAPSTSAPPRISEPGL